MLAVLMSCALLFEELELLSTTIIRNKIDTESLKAPLFARLGVSDQKAEPAD